MGIVVQKYGGSSVADATGIKRVAQRIVNTKRAGSDVVVVVSAMGDTTDELRDLAEQVTPLPPPRELDMLLTAGERISMALLAMAIAQLGHKAQSFTGSQAGVITDSAHGRAKIIDITPGRIVDAIDAGSIAIVAGFQGVSQDTKDVTTLGRGRVRHHRGGPGRRPRRRGVRDLQRRRRRLHRRPAHRADRPQARPRLPRGDARDGGLGRQDPAPALRRVRPPLRHPRPRPVLLLAEGRDLGRRRPDRQLPGGDRYGTGHHRRRRARPQRGQDHRRRRARQGRRGGAHLRGARLGRGQHRHGRPEHLGRRHRADRHLLHAAARRRPRRDGVRWRASRTRSATTSSSTTTRSARCP